MRFKLLLLASTLYSATYGWTYTFINKTKKTITVTAKLRSLKKGTPGQALCQATVLPGQSQPCDTGDQCAQVLFVMQEGALQGQTFNLESSCHNMEYTFGESQYGSLGMVTITQRIIK